MNITAVTKAAITSMAVKWDTYLKSRRNPESLVQKQILDWLKLNPDLGYFFRVHNTGIYDPKRSVFRTNQHKGLADIMGVSKGRFIAIEVKTGNGKLSYDQDQFKSHVQENDGRYIEARSIEDVIEGLK